MVPAGRPESGVPFVAVCKLPGAFDFTGKLCGAFDSAGGPGDPFPACRGPGGPLPPATEVDGSLAFTSGDGPGAIFAVLGSPGSGEALTAIGEAILLSSGIFDPGGPTGPPFAVGRGGGVCF